MMNRKATKRALLSSVVALLLCFSMLIGTTFAWFTDSVTSANNKIVAGNLDIELDYYDGAEWKTVNNATDLFGDKLWEPGHTQTAYLRLRNLGSLALKYQLGINIVSETGGTNVAGEPFKLSDYIYMGVVEDQQPSFATREAAVAAVADAGIIGEGYTKSGEMTAGQDDLYLAVVVYMPTTVGNEANHKTGTAAPQIDLGINVMATQLTHEEDSFDELYDQDAEYPETFSPAPSDAVAVSDFEQLKAALVNGDNIKLTADISVPEALAVSVNAAIYGEGHTISRAEGYTGTVFSVNNGTTLTMENITLDGSGATATGNLIATAGNGSIVLNKGAVLQNNNGAHAVNLATRGGGTLTLNGAKIINNSSDSGAIWGGGHIIVNEGSKISYNSSTGIAGAIRMVSSCNLTVNGGEISYNKAAGDGGAIWGYGASTYTFTGGEMAHNESAGTGGAIYTGTYSVINMSGDFELHDNKAANSGAIRLTDHTSMNMTGGKVYNNTQNGESNAFNTWNNSISITGGEISDDISFVGGLGLTVGAADVDGVIHYNLSTNHNTAYLAAEFNGFKFTVNEADEHFANFNFKPAAGYTYTAGDEAKLVCMNEGYSTYWDAVTGTFRLKAN